MLNVSQAMPNEGDVGGHARRLPFNRRLSEGERRGIAMSWLDVITPLTVIRLLTLLFFIASSKGLPYDSRYR
jgi:hypothetical protein